MTNDELQAQVTKLQAFKDWVHAYLDAHGVPHHPPGVHGAEGCRIGDRMDWLMARHAGLLAACKTARDELAILHDEIKANDISLPIGEIADRLDELDAAIESAEPSPST